MRPNQEFYNLMSGRGDYGIFVTEDSNSIITSRDGITWTQVDNNGVYDAGVYGGDKFVFVSSTYSFISYDLVTFDSPRSLGTTLSVSGEPPALCYSKELGLFVAGGLIPSAIGNTIISSSDGITWTQRYLSSNLISWNSIIWSKEKSLFVIVGESSTSGLNIILTSPNGITWTERVVSSTNYELDGVAYSPSLGLFVAVGGSASGVGAGGFTTHYSSDGISWTASALGYGSNNLSDVCWSSELAMFVAVGDGDSTSNNIVTSTNGTTWTPRSMSGFAGAFNKCAWSPKLGLFVAQSSFGNGRTYTSTNGTTWIDRGTISDQAQTSWSLIWAEEFVNR